MRLRRYLARNTKIQTFYRQRGERVSFVCVCVCVCVCGLIHVFPQFYCFTPSQLISLILRSNGFAPALCIKKDEKRKSINPPLHINAHTPFLLFALSLCQMRTHTQKCMHRQKEDIFLGTDYETTEPWNALLISRPISDLGFMIREIIMMKNRKRKESSKYTVHSKICLYILFHCQQI